MRQSHQFQLGLIKSDSGSLTIMRRSSINYARIPRISDLFVPQIVNRNREIMPAPALRTLNPVNSDLHQPRESAN